MRFFDSNVRMDGTASDTADNSAHFFQLPESTISVGSDRDLIIECRVRGNPRPKGNLNSLMSHTKSITMVQFCNAIF